MTDEMVMKAWKRVLGVYFRKGILTLERVANTPLEQLLNEDDYEKLQFSLRVVVACDMEILTDSEAYKILSGKCKTENEMLWWLTDEFQTEYETHWENLGIYANKCEKWGLTQK